MNQTKESPLARGYLDRARKAKIQVNLLKQRIMNLRMLTTDTSVHLTENRIQNDSADKNKLLTLTAQIDEMERELEETKEALENIRLEIGIMICRLNDPFIQRVLIMHYLDYKSWRAIAREIGYSHAQIFRYRDAGLAELEEILKPFTDET